MRGSVYFAKRVTLAAGTVFVAITLNFILFRAAPGDAVSNLSRVPHASPALKEALRHEFGLDQSKWQQYWLYLDQLFHGNLGISFADQQPVSHDLTVALGNTVPMVLLGTVIAIGLGVVTGTVAAWRRGGITDQVNTNVAIAFYSFPTQWLGLMLLILFAGVLPTSGMSDEFLIDPTWWEHTVDVLKHMILPSATLALTLYGEYTLIARSSMLETLSEDYVLTARAKGLPNSTVVRRHAFRNALLPTTTLVALSLGYVVGGAILIETVFSWPGIGRAVYQAVLQRDYPMLQGAFLVLTLSVVVFNLIADLLYFRLDPRVTE
ncbi:MAG TPA: ABC transporter permease [Nocardioidaceae bacterium]|nr:ABC transporter permease [Nocardioidaceae bacterium]